MSQMKELFEKVSNDTMLQEKFFAIIDDAQSANEDATKEKLITFAKAAGYDVTLEEMAMFFKDLIKKEEGELTDIELDMVAGGKGSVSKNFTRLFSKAERNAGKIVDDSIGWLF